MTGGVGAFGKVPGMGDFLRLNLPAGAVQAWDGWLQGAMIAVRQSLGDRWDGCYLSAPIWRFSLPAMPELPALSGVLMASVDRVGRQYPLTLMAPCPGGPAALRHFVNGAFFDRLEGVALAALEDDLGRDALVARLADIAPLIPQAQQFNPAAYAGTLPPEMHLAARAIPADAGIWTADMAGDHRMLLSHGLPDPAQMRALLDPADNLWAGAGATVSA